MQLAVFPEPTAPTIAVPVKSPRSGMTSLRLLAPAAELHISPCHDLQCGIDDVIRRALDEGRVLFDGDRDWLV